MSTTDAPRKREREQEYQNRREHYKWLKSQGICPRCGIMPAAPNRVSCISCLEYDATYRFVRSNTRAPATSDEKAEARMRADEFNRQQRERYARQKAAGLCTVSGCTKPMWNGHVRCMEHFLANARSREESRRKRSALEPVRVPKPRPGNPHPLPPGPNHPWRMANKLIANPLRRNRERGETE